MSVVAIIAVGVASQTARPMIVLMLLVALVAFVWRSVDSLRRRRRARREARCIEQIAAYASLRRLPSLDAKRSGVSAEEFAECAAFVAERLSGEAQVRVGVVVRLSGVEQCLLADAATAPSRRRAHLLALVARLPLGRDGDELLSEEPMSDMAEFVTKVSHRHNFCKFLSVKIMKYRKKVLSLVKLKKRL